MQINLKQFLDQLKNQFVEEVDEQEPDGVEQIARCFDVAVGKLLVEMIDGDTEKTEVSKPVETPKAKRGGRPAGSKNKPKDSGQGSPSTSADAASLERAQRAMAGPDENYPG